MELLGIAWENIFIGLLSGAFVGSFVLIKNWLINFRIERKFPIAGRYLSRFEDELNGEKLVVTAPAILKQKGRKIHGETYMPEDERKWILDGELSSGGHIHGVYYAEDPHDKGIGNFFLFINYRKQMNGLWSGFDSVNQKITSGRYSFEPIIDDLEVRDATYKDLARILEISDAELGTDYLDETIKEQMTSENTVFRVAETDKEGITGFCYSYFSDADELMRSLSIKDLPKYLKISSKFAVLKTIAVKSNNKGRGVGSALMKDSIEIFRDKNIDSIYSVAWKSKSGTNIAGLMHLYEFKLYEEIENFWTEDSKTKGYSCPECGNPCVCSAMIYTKVL